jgi:hypothetical protein
MTHPVPGYGVGTPYGRPGNIWAAGHHTGVDFPAPTGAKVRATTSGKVIHVGWGGWGQAYGAHIIIDTGHRQHGYMHLSRTAVRSGQHVSAGQYIGRVGETGHAFGPHCHYEVRKSPYRYGNDVNPMPYVESHATAHSGTKFPVWIGKLKFGTRNSASVKELQRALNRHHMKYVKPLPVTGYYGPATDFAVRHCQSIHGNGWSQAHMDPKGKSNVGRKQAHHLGIRVRS